MYRFTSHLAALVVCLLFASIGSAQENGSPASDSYSSLDRKILSVLTPEQAERFVAGLDAALIELANGETLEEFITRLERVQEAGLLYRPLASPCVILDTKASGLRLAANESKTLFVRSATSASHESDGDCALPPLTGDVFKTNPSRAVLLSVEVSDVDRVGRLGIWPSNESSEPRFGLISVRPSAEEHGVTSTTIVSTCDEENLNPCQDGDVTIQAQGTGMHVAIRALGYFETALNLAANQSTSDPLGETATDSRNIHYPDGKAGIGESDSSAKPHVSGSDNGTNATAQINSGDGNAGIGTTGSGARLVVDGEIRSGSICDETGANCKDTSTVWPDGNSLDTADGSQGNVVHVTGVRQVRIRGDLDIDDDLDVDKNVRIGSNSSETENHVFMGRFGGGQIELETFFSGGASILLEGGGSSGNGVEISADDDGEGTVTTDQIEVMDLLEIQPRSSAPSSPSQGTIYYDSSGALCVYNGSGWDKIGGGSCS